MEPSPLSDGDADHGQPARRRAHASMEPSPLSDGDCARAGDAPRRAPASMEPSPLSDGDLVDVRDHQPGIVGFNGAVASQRRRPATAPDTLLSLVELQWSRRLSATET